MIPKIFIIFGVLVYAIVVPYLEVNASHVYNSGWPPHARLHEVWQLVTNCCIGAIAFWIAWSKENIRLASMLNISVMGGVLVAHALADFYGGNILSGNVSKTILGMDLAVFTASLVVVLSAVAFFMSDRRWK